MKRLSLIAAFWGVLFCPPFAWAGLDLENQQDIHIPALDLDNDGRILRTEVAEYLFFYFDHDGNEVLTKGEYHKERPLTVLPYEVESVPFIDIDNDKQHDEGVYTTERFIRAVMVDEEAYDPEAEGLKAYRLMDLYFSRFDKDKSGAIELDEWQKYYRKFAAKKPNVAPKAADQDYYAQ